MIDVLVIGLSLGCVYGIVAMGFSLAYRTTGVLSFAQGAFVMLGAMMSAVAVSRWGAPLWLAFLIGIAVAAISGLVLASTIVLPLWKRNADPFVTILGTALFLTIAQNIVLNVFGSDPVSLPPITEGGFHFAGRVIDYQVVYVVVFAIAMAVLFPWWLNRSRLGASMQACAIDREAARLVGISPVRTAVMALVIAAAFTGLAGSLIAPIQFASYSIGMVFNVRGFIAAMIGGLNNIRSAFYGGVVLGVGESVVGVYLSTRYLDTIVLAILVLIILARPQGIFSRKGEALEGA